MLIVIDFLRMHLNFSYELVAIPEVSVVNISTWNGSRNAVIEFFQQQVKLIDWCLINHTPSCFFFVFLERK